MHCSKCSFDYSKWAGEFNFCPKCGERLPDLPHLSQGAWRAVQAADLAFSIVRLIAPALLGAGIALWFMGPAWFYYTETRTIRAISVALMAGGPLLFVLALLARRLAEDLALRGAVKGSDKKPANIYLLLDVSGSMEGNKLSGAKRAAESFLTQMNEEQDQIGLISFSTEVTEVRNLAPANPAALVSSIRGLKAEGTTALYDAFIHAIGRLQELGSPERSNVILAMTDGHNQGGSHSLDDVGDRMTDADLPVSIFTVGYGKDADMKVIEQISQWGHGQAYKANRRTIRRLYQLLSAFF